MTILYHHRTLMDGAEGVHIREMIHAFERLGHSVITMSPVTASGANQANSALGRLRRYLPQELFELASAAYSVSERRSARRTIKSARPALIYKRHALNDLGILQAARASGVPAILEVNVLYSSTTLGQFEPLRFKRLARSIERRALELADIVVVVSTPLGGLVRELAPRARSVVGLPNGVDHVRFSPEISGHEVRSRYRLPEGAVVVGWCGIMRSWHGLDLLLRAVAQTPLFLFLIGDGPERPRIEQLAREVGIVDRVRFSGRVSPNEMPAHLAAIDIGVVADDLTRFASPMKLLEYMAMRKAVVAPDLPNIRDLVSDGVEGLLFEPGDVDSLRERLARLEDVGTRQVLGTAGRHRVETDRNWVANAKRVLSLVKLTDLSF